MSNYNQNQAQVASPDPAAKTQSQAPAYTAPPPPAGYPVRDGQSAHSGPAPGKTTSRGSGFWEVCRAACCCYHIIDLCSYCCC